MRRHERLARVCLIARADLGTRRASWRRSCRSGSVPAGGRPGGGHDWSAGVTGFAHSTVWKVLKRAGLSRPAGSPREAANRYEWPCPGDLLHMDTSRYARFLRPGHRVTGDRSQTLTQLDGPRDQGRLRLRTRDRRRPLSPCLRRAPQRREGRNGHGLRERALGVLCRARDPRQTADDRQRLQLRQEPLPARTARRTRRSVTSRTEPYRPRTNGKVERFHQTMGREWAYGLAYRSHHARNQALPHWINHYNQTQTPQLTRKPAPNQPRSQRPWVGQLEGRRAARERPPRSQIPVAFTPEVGLDIEMLVVCDVDHTPRASPRRRGRG